MAGRVGDINQEKKRKKVLPLPNIFVILFFFFSCGESHARAASTNAEKIIFLKKKSRTCVVFPLKTETPDWVTDGGGSRENFQREREDFQRGKKKTADELATSHQPSPPLFLGKWQSKFNWRQMAEKKKGEKDAGEKWSPIRNGKRKEGSMWN